MKFISRLFSDTAISFVDRSAHCVKGRKITGLLTDLSTLAGKRGIDNGEIWIDGSGKVGFSREIAEAVHQRIRNIVTSHIR